MAVTENTVQEFPKINFSGLDLIKSPGSEIWNTTRGQVMHAITTHGFFQAVFNDITPETLDQLFGPLLKDLFQLPIETKLRNSSDKPFHGYGRRFEFGRNYETLHIDDAYSLDAIDGFTRLMWPEGNIMFRDTLWSFVKALADIELIFRRMLMEGLGVGKYFDYLEKSTKHAVRLIEYGAPDNHETMIGLDDHVDVTFISIVYQHDEGGLELKSTNGGGDWFHAPPKSIVLMLSEGLKAWSNERLEPTLHRVKMINNRTRHSIAIGSVFRDGHMIKAPDELVDKDHPMIYKPYDHAAYLRFRFIEPGYKGKDALKAYCGVDNN